MSNIFYNKCFAENGKTVNISGCPEQAQNCSFVHNTDKTTPSLTSMTHPTHPSLARDHSEAPPAPAPMSWLLVSAVCYLFTN